MNQLVDTVKHTALPWYVDMDPIDTATDIRAKWGWNGQERIPGQLLAQMVGKRDDVRDANAHFICLAVNSHAALVEACDAARKYIEGCQGTGRWTDIDWEAIGNQLRAALALAHGKKEV